MTAPTMVRVNTRPVRYMINENKRSGIIMKGLRTRKTIATLL